MSQKIIISFNSSFSLLGRQAWQALEGRRLISVGAQLLYVVIMGAVQSAAGGLGQFFLNPLTAGVSLFFLTLFRREPVSIELLFKPFSQYGRYLWAGLRMFIFILLWGVLFVIPGIVAALRYALTYYIMLDKPELSVKAAMQESAAMIYGHKWRLFWYGIVTGMIGFFVTVLTLGIGLFWYSPWAGTFFAAFYETLRRNSCLERPCFTETAD